MNEVIKKFYIVGLAAAMIVALGMYIEYNFFEKIIKKEIQTNISLKRDNIGSVISSRLVRKGQIIKQAAAYISSEKEDEKILHFLRGLMASDSAFSSIYFGTIDNKMINGSGWVPQKDFDLRTQLWYKKTIREDKLVYTGVFLNASQDKYIITLAQPVYDSNHQLLGVVAGDIHVEDILSLVADQKISNHGYSFVIDGDGNILAHTYPEYALIAKPLNIKKISERLASQILQNKAGIMQGTLKGIDGYIAYQSIEETDWRFGSFIPMDDYINPKKQILIIFFITILASCVTFGVLVIQQRKHIIKPLIKFNKDIQHISVEKNIDYRLQLETKDPFVPLRQSVNAVLEKAQDYFGQLKQKEEKLMALNKELSNALHKLMMAENELRESEEHNRAIVNVLPDAIFVLNKEGRFLDYQAGDDSQILFNKENFLGKFITDVMPESIAAEAMVCIKKALSTNELQIVEYSSERLNEINYFETRVIKSKEDEVIAITRNITEQKKNLMHIEYLSYHDQLTGLYNRRYLEELLEKLDGEQQFPFTVAVIDVNGLKLTNDAFGHGAGDKLLKKVAEILAKECRPEDVIARIGGDEFVIVLQKTTHGETDKVVKKIYEAVSNERIGEVLISVSIGWETKYTAEQTIKDILTKAEEHMYRKKLTESQSVRNETIKVITHTLNEKNENDKIHSEKVSLLSKQIGEAMKLDYETIKEIEIAGLMHDIGKIAINDSLLSKPGQLTEEEYAEVKKHTDIGYQILKSVDAYSSLAEYVLSHHERWDGQGYPRKLRGKDIPLVARIIAVADAYEAMTADRPYRKGLSSDAAIEELRKQAGTQFDPEITELFIELIKSDNIKIN